MASAFCIIGLMDTKELDIVYCLKNGNEDFDELRYSLRSLENFPHRNIWIYGGCPNWVKNVRHVPMVQPLTKWQNSTRMLEEACRNNEISKDFVWFNDDFFIMKPVEKLEYWHDRTLRERADDFRTRLQPTSRYGATLLAVSAALENAGKPTKNYALHIPIIFNRYQFLAMCRKYPSIIHGRSPYANEYEVDSIQHPDVKIYDLHSEIPEDAIFASTTNTSFEQGLVGKMIRQAFPNPCEYEKTATQHFAASPGFKLR